MEWKQTGLCHFTFKVTNQLQFFRSHWSHAETMEEKGLDSTIIINYH